MFHGCNRICNTHGLLRKIWGIKQSDADAKLTLVMMQTAVDTLTTIKQTSDKTAIKFQEVKENDGETQNV